MERAEAVLDRSTDLAAAAGPHDVGAAALHLLRAADHDHSTLDHALRIGTRRLHLEPASHGARRAVQLLESVIGFLGRRPHGGRDGR